MAWGRQAGDEWKASRQFQRVDYRRWDAANVHQIGREQEWPADLQWVYRDFISRQAELEPEDYAKLGNANTFGSPRFFLIQNGKLTNSAVGLNGWKYRIVPLLNQLVGS
jgi:hypothetical protein